MDSLKVIEKLGTKHAIDMLMEAGEEQGRIMIRELSRHLSSDLEALDAGEKMFKTFMEDAGAEVSIHVKGENSVTFHINRCPFYDAFLDVGVECGIFLEKLCENLTLPVIQEVLKTLDTRLRVENVLSKKVAEDFCLERVYMLRG